MSYIALSASFEYTICHGSTATIFCLIIAVLVPSLDVKWPTINPFPSSAVYMTHKYLTLANNSNITSDFCQKHSNPSSTKWRVYVSYSRWRAYVLYSL